MKILDNMDLCYGCAACANKCSFGAITMESADDGFLYPVIDDTKCVNCGACQKVCPVLNADYKNAKEPEVYAAMASDEIRTKSASGGVFSLLASRVLKMGGYVCGAAFDDDFLGVSQIIINDAEELDKLRRSKYIQSRNGDIYKQVESHLCEDAYVLFTGTPCQCAALKAYLKKPYEKLLIVDLICHGTPSPKAWDAFISEIGNGRRIADVNFRYKGLIGWSATTYVKFEDGNEYIKLFKEDNFEQASSKNLISRKSCSTCQFARVPRQGDLTIGDFWGVKKALDDRKGTSAILVNSEKGKQFIELLDQNGAFLKLESIPFYESFARKNSNVYRFPQAHPGRSRFFDILNEGGKFSKALDESKGTKYDAVLFSIWYAANYGSLMTNFALYKVLEDKGYNCIFADIPDHLWPKSKNHRHPLFVTRRFAYKHFKLTPKYKDRKDLKKLNSISDTFIVGSDQIWNYSLCKTADTYFFLDFVDAHKKKIAYGTSFGHDSFRGNEEEKKRAGFYLKRFDAVSVREKNAVDLCKNEFGVDAVEVLDPVFVCDRKHYDKCIEQSSLAKNPPNRKYVLAYILDPDDHKQQTIKNVAEKLDADIVCIPNAHVDEKMRKNWKLPILENIDMEDWLYYFRNAEFVITDSFHGTCFSLIFERNFAAIGNKRRGIARFSVLLDKFSLTNRLVYNPSDIESNLHEFLEAIDYKKVNATIGKLRSESVKWLDSVLNKEKAPSVYTSYDLLDRRIDDVSEQLIEKNKASNKRIDDLLKSLEQKEKEIQKTLDEVSETLKRINKQEKNCLTKPKKSFFKRVCCKVKNLLSKKQ